MLNCRVLETVTAQKITQSTDEKITCENLKAPNSYSISDVVAPDNFCDEGDIQTICYIRSTKSIPSYSAREVKVNRLVIESGGRINSASTRHVNGSTELPLGLKLTAYSIDMQAGSKISGDGLGRPWRDGAHLEIDVHDTFTMNGEVLSRGSARGGYAGGSAGNITINAGTIEGTGTFYINGANGSNGTRGNGWGKNGGDGGKLRVYANYEENLFTINMNAGSGGRRYGTSVYTPNGTAGTKGTYFFFDGKNLLFRQILLT